MNGERQNGDAQPCCRSDKRFADTAGNGDGLSFLQIEDTESRNHADDCAEQPEQRRHRYDYIQIVQARPEFGQADTGLNFQKSGQIDMRGVHFVEGKAD